MLSNIHYEHFAGFSTLVSIALLIYSKVIPRSGYIEKVTNDILQKSIPP